MVTQAVNNQQPIQMMPACDSSVMTLFRRMG